jgi:hypothetical protein
VRSVLDKLYQEIQKLAKILNRSLSTQTLKGEKSHKNQDKALASIHRRRFTIPMKVSSNLDLLRQDRRFGILFAGRPVIRVQLYTKLEFRDYCRQDFRACMPTNDPHRFEQDNGAIPVEMNCVHRKPGSFFSQLRSAVPRGDDTTLQFNST